MTHYRSRIIENELKKALAYSPCVGILGMRQVGKSTLLKKYSQRYFSFDDDEFLIRFGVAAKTYLEEMSYPLGLDEVQKYPPAFDALKFAVDSLKKTGRFLLSGSVRFSARKEIRESLTGRIVILEVMPLTLSECHGARVSEFLKKLFHSTDELLLKKIGSAAWATEEQVVHYSKTGGLPGICFRREEAIRLRMLDNHLDTLFGRDIHLIVKTKLSIKKLKDVVAAIAREQGLPISYSTLARLASVSVPTMQSLLVALQGLFLIRSYGKTYFVEDAGLSHFLSPMNNLVDRRDMLRCLYGEFKTQMETQLKFEATLEPFTTRGGIDVPFVGTFKNGERIAIGVEAHDQPSDKTVKSLVWFKKKFPKSRLFILTRGNKTMKLSSGIVCVPWTWAF